MSVRDGVLHQVINLINCSSMESTSMASPGMVHTRATILFTANTISASVVPVKVMCTV